MRTNWFGQLLDEIASDEVTVTAPPQFSAMVPPWARKLLELVAGAGTATAHSTVTFVGHVITGAVVSLTVMVWSQFVLLLQSSVNV